VSLEEIAVITLCLFGGYWGVCFLFHRQDRERGPRADAALAQHQQSPPPAWTAILGVSADASIDAIRQAYQHRIAEYHPDKVAALGAELRELAERKSKEINLAYDEARRARGEHT
jgi:DnaJ-domain-containing protein 1